MIRPTTNIDGFSPEASADEAGIAARVATNELAGEPEWVNTNHTGGLKRLPLRVTMQ